MMNILITGGAGFIGSQLVNVIYDRNPKAKVIVIDNLSTGKKKMLNPGAKFFKIDIKNKLDEVLNFGIQSCIKAYELEYNKPFDKISTDCWVNVVRTNNPIQYKNSVNGLDYHIHTEINKNNKLIYSVLYQHYTNSIEMFFSSKI